MFLSGFLKVGALHFSTTVLFDTTLLNCIMLTHFITTYMQINSPNFTYISYFIHNVIHYLGISVVHPCLNSITQTSKPHCFLGCRGQSHAITSSDTIRKQQKLKDLCCMCNNSISGHFPIPSLHQ